MTVSNKKILDKIRKCLALAKSSNPHEAAVALRQAQKLMQAHNVSEQDVDLLNVQAFCTTAGRAKKPARWMHGLVAVVCKAFEVEAIFQSLYEGGAAVKFIGIDEKPEVAGYAFDVLYRQLVRDRNAHIKQQSRCKPATKTRRGDLFAEAWVGAVHDHIVKFAQPIPDAHKTLIKSYLDKRHSNRVDAITKKHTAKRNDWQSEMAGYKQGKKCTVESWR
ncbi:DUF2786 domain-containing protein [Gynuella sp.]|uniref:DUF2786 domain-containing protein n=1 Tax=Gynuella sp. TaxID=2969146 RepID=UPI003D0E0B80